MKLLLERGWDRARRSKEGKTALDLAKEGGFADVRVALVQ